MRFPGLWALAAWAIGCGSSNSGTTDAPHPPIDMAIIDGAPDAPPDAAIDAPPAMGTHTHYVISREYVPTTSSQAHDYGLDLNGDGVVDNQLGSVLSTLAAMGAPVQQETDLAIDTGANILLADLQATAYATATNAGFATYVGTNPNPLPCTGPTDTVCRHHLQGTGSFDVDPTAPVEGPLTGNIVGGVLTAGPGRLVVNANVLNATVTLDLIGARVKISATATGITTGVLAGGVTMSDMNTQVYPAVQMGLAAVVAADCTMPLSPPTCGCITGSNGATYLSLFDGDINGVKDCKISIEEVEQNTLIMSLLAPDVTINGMPALSVGVKIEAVDGTFTP